MHDKPFQVIPILRIFDEAKARAFYLDWLGFEVDFEHRFEPGMPIYMQIRRGNMVLHLSEHHGDACPGSTTFVVTTDLASLHQELLAKDYKYNRPGLDRAVWDGWCMETTDPFGNRLRFAEYESHAGGGGK